MPYIYLVNSYLLNMKYLLTNCRTCKHGRPKFAFAHCEHSATKVCRQIVNRRHLNKTIASNYAFRKRMPFSIVWWHSSNAKGTTHMLPKPMALAVPKLSYIGLDLAGARGYYIRAESASFMLPLASTILLSMRPIPGLDEWAREFCRNSISNAILKRWRKPGRCRECFLYPFRNSTKHTTKFIPRVHPGITSSLI